MRDRVYTIVYMTVLCAAATLLMTGAKLALSDRVTENETLRTNRARLAGLDLHPTGTGAREVNEMYEKRVRRETRNGREVYVAYEDDGKTVHAIGVFFSGKGFWGPIRGMISTDPQGREIRGIVFSDHVETPGLGGRIGEGWFTAQFRGKSAAGEGAGLAFLPEGAPANGPQEVNAISGATRTSESARTIVNQALRDLRAALAAPAGRN